MIFVSLFQIIVLVIAFFECESAALLRTPKVYNALITTDQNLTPSRAYPVIQPAIHDPFFYGPYGYTPYSYYDPFGFNPFESAAYIPKFNTDGTINVSASSGGAAAAAAAAAGGAGAVGATEETVSRSAGGNKEDGAVAQAANTEKSPIPLNEFGFPPSLIPLSSGKTPINLAPFSYHSYPLVYDQFGGYQQAAYLPHFGVLPQTPYTAFGGVPQTKVDEKGQAAGGGDAESNAAAAADAANAAGQLGGTPAPAIDGAGYGGVPGFGGPSYGGPGYGGALGGSGYGAPGFNTPGFNTPGLDGPASGSDIAQGAPGVAGNLHILFPFEYVYEFYNFTKELPKCVASISLSLQISPDKVDLALSVKEMKV